MEALNESIGSAELAERPGFISAACSRRRSTTYIPVGVGRWFQTRLYHPALAGTPPEEGNWNHLGGLFPT